MVRKRVLRERFTLAVVEVGELVFNLLERKSESEIGSKSMSEISGDERRLVFPVSFAGQLPPSQPQRVADDN